MLYYAVKSVDNKPVNKIYDDWDQCKIVVWGKKVSATLSTPLTPHS